MFLSKAATEWLLALSEVSLLVFGILLVVGLIGEFKEELLRRKLIRWFGRKNIRLTFGLRPFIKICELFVIIGVAGELFADGGIFLFSHHLQTISDKEVSVANERAEAARVKAALVESNNLSLEVSIRQLARQYDQSTNALEVATVRLKQSEIALASASNQVAKTEQSRAGLEKQIADANRIAGLAAKSAEASGQKLQDRRITPQQREIILKELKGFGELFEVHFSSGDPEIARYASDIIEVMKAAGFNVQPHTAINLILAGVPTVGLSITVDPKRLPPNAILMQSVLNKAGVQAKWQATEGIGNKFLAHIGRKI